MFVDADLFVDDLMKRFDWMLAVARNLGAHGSLPAQLSASKAELGTDVSEKLSAFDDDGYCHDGDSH